MERHGTFSETRAHGSLGLTLMTISPCVPGKRALCKLSLWTVYCPAAAGRPYPRECTTNQEFLFLLERHGNIYENKEPLWKEWGRSGNVIENKGTYRQGAGMLLKIQVVSRRQVVGGGRTGVRIRDSGFRCQVTGALRNCEWRMVNSELLSSFSPPPNAFCLMPTAYLF
jgi:hypothetical protein